MKNQKTRKFIVTLIIVSILSTIISSFVNQARAEKWIEYVEPEQYRFNAQDVLLWAAKFGAGTADRKVEYPAIPTEITSTMISNKTAIAVTDANEGMLNAYDAQLLKFASQARTADVFQIGESVVEALGVSSDDVTITYTIDMPEVKEKNIKGESISYQVKNKKFIIKTVKRLIFEDGLFFGIL